MSSPKTIADISFELDIAEPVIQANMIRMLHLGLVVAGTLATVWAPGSDRRLRMWSMTRHALEHKQIMSNCWACRIRMHYMTVCEALLE